VMHTSVVG